jgi:hypothetical protein
VAQAASPQKIVANQVHYSVRVREPERTGLLSTLPGERRDARGVAAGGKSVSACATTWSML